MIIERKGDNFTSIYYTPTGIIPANGLLAVYCNEVENDPDSLEMSSWPLDFVGLGTSIEKTFSKGDSYCSPIRKEKHSGQLIGITIYNDGSSEVCNEMDNFCGFAKPGDDIREIDAYMPTEFGKRKNRIVKADDPSLVSRSA